ncbi:hypothetical protein FACS189434_01710 [Bacteroidia bacterium]|nr:hypothetical protein FACS189434_01710 [Bacteroidia bacterium]
MGDTVEITQDMISGTDWGLCDLQILTNNEEQAEVEKKRSEDWTTCNLYLNIFEE